jgi:hypothetical protein
MTVGQQSSKTQVDQLISQLTVSMRNVMQAVVNLSMQVNGQGSGETYLEGLPDPYDSADATTAVNAIAYLNTVAGVYFGTASQGTEYNFDQQLSQYWAGQ